MIPTDAPPPPVPLSSRYPDPSIEMLHPDFARIRLANAGVERLADGCRWSEGPVWFGDGRFLLWSDIPNDRMMKWDEETGRACVFRKPSGFANGNTRDRAGRLVSCEHGARRVTRTEPDGSITVLADRHLGRRLSSPNDVIVAADGAVWFTDPPFGILGNYEGSPAEQELPDAVYRIDPQDGSLAVAADDISGPNGLCFSPDERILYVVESRSRPRRLLAYDACCGTLSNRRILINAGAGTPDGLRCDIDGNLWMGWGSGEGLDGVLVFSPRGEPLAHVHLPERCANLCFGGRHRNRLFMAASRSLYAVYVNTQGALP